MAAKMTTPTTTMMMTTMKIPRRRRDCLWWIVGKCAPAEGGCSVVLLMGMSNFRAACVCVWVLRLLLLWLAAGDCSTCVFTIEIFCCKRKMPTPKRPPQNSKCSCNTHYSLSFSLSHTHTRTSFYTLMKTTCNKNWLNIIQQQSRFYSLQLLQQH